ncbi:RNA-binding protein [Bailinhaonella thermotolerans]|uniref:RNA-binding protein n=2 Tax=Bailinhaonella thermotolerans TaxID=1070861 RepID=A0A3A4B061_9ACTN|nr:RNA-binding protein [Bailinhaonella thermotolerans]
MNSSPDGLDRPLPEAVRQHVVELAAQALGTLPAEQLPATLKPFARFEPRRRARLAAPHLAAQLEADKDFRERVAEALEAGSPELVAALREGRLPAAADPVVLASAAYLVRPAGWQDTVEVARADLDRAAAVAEGNAAEEAAARLREQLAAAKAALKEDTERLREQLRSARAENAELRRKLHEARERARAAERDREDLLQQVTAERAAAATAAGATESELRRLRERLADAERQLESGRRVARGERSLEDARLRVLLDTLQEAAAGLRRELALPTSITRPADSVEAISPESPGVRGIPARALSDDDPALLDQLLALPQVHLIVDGYNVTKTGYPHLTLADQRARLLTGLSALATQIRAEVTCVWDGAELGAPVSVPAPRGVRVRFSAPGQTADDLIRELVRAEPQGRPVVVFSADREVADSVRRDGARPVPSTLLLKRLSRA